MTHRTQRVLVRGVGSHNGGAELLLRAVVDRLGKGSARAVADVRRTSGQLLQGWNVGGYFSVPKLGFAESGGLDLLPGSVAQRLDTYGTRHIAAVLDASGFFLGDQWVPRSLERDSVMFAKYRNRKLPLVFLPQAFGPFERPEIAVPSRRILMCADYIFARDSVSVSHVRRLLGDDFDLTKIRRVPDITIGLDRGKSIPRSGRVAIVPNVNIPRRAPGDPDSNVKKYANELLAAYRQLEAVGTQPLVLLHSLDGDPTVVKAMRDIRADIDVVTPGDGYIAKNLIGSLAGIITGRYHAAVSAFAAGVPVVVHSWSHKYLELLHDFKVKEGLGDPWDGAGSVQMLNALRENETYMQAVAASGPQLRLTIDEMWSSITSLLQVRMRD